MQPIEPAKTEGVNWKKEESSWTALRRLGAFLVVAVAGVLVSHFTTHGGALTPPRRVKKACANPASIRRGLRRAWASLREEARSSPAVGAAAREVGEVVMEWTYPP